MLLLGDRAEDVAAWVSSKLAPPLRGAPRRTAVCTGAGTPPFDAGTPRQPDHSHR